ncbi:MAG: glycosyltransferase [Thermoanaerobaculia bacterium]
MALKVLHVIPSVAPRDGGPSHAVLKMTSELRKAGLNVTLATTDADGSGRLDVRTGTVEEHRGVPTIFFPMQFSESFKYSRPFASWLAASVPEFDCAHIHGVFSHAPMAAARACRRSGIPYVVRPLGALEEWSLSQKSGRKRVALAVGARKMLVGAAAIHYTTERERRESERMLGLTNGIVIPLGVEMPAARGANPSSAPRPPLPAGGEGTGERFAAKTILFLSRLHPKKGVELLLEAFAGMTARKAETARPHPLPPLPPGEGVAGGPGERSRTRSDTGHFRLVIAGSGEPDYESRLRRLAESLGISEKVTFPGWLDGDAKTAALAGADLFVLPSSQENFGLAVLEAMAAGVPVAVSREVDLSDEVEASGAGWVFERTVGGIAATLAEALLDLTPLPPLPPGEGVAERPEERSGADERRSRGARGRALVERKFLWPEIAKELEEMYGRITSPRPHGHPSRVDLSS